MEETQQPCKQAHSVGFIVLYDGRVWSIIATKIEIIMIAMKMKIITKHTGLHWKLFKADFPDFGEKEIFMMLVEAKVFGGGFFPSPSTSFGISSTTGP